MSFYGKLSILSLSFLFFIDAANAIKTHQIMRKVEQDGRDVIEAEQIQDRIEFRKDILEAKKENTEPLFHIHEEIVCRGQASSAPGAQEEIVRKTRFTERLVRKSPLRFAVMIEVIKAHLYISETLYKKGEFILTNQVRYHTNEEAVFYPDYILKEEVFDLYKSALYLKYVVMPVVEPFMTPEEIKDTHLILEFLREPSTLPDGVKTHKYIDPKGRKQSFRYYKKYVDILYKRFDQVRDRHFKENNIVFNQKLSLLTVIALLNHSWQAYKNTGICDHYTDILDPVVDPLDIALPDYHDSYVMGYGLLARADDLVQEYGIASRKLSVKDRKIILDMITEFRGIYNDIIMDSEKRVSYSRFDKKFRRFKMVLKERFIKK